ncbi:hypothetical protein KBD75_01520 [Candidatus Woesebacteria bacterium]|nr:hypothetical protein [Candidatus Woesebacteria bacterium]
MRATRYILLLISLILFAIYAYLYTINNPTISPKDISTFEECVASGYPIMESYPEQCHVPGGSTFTRVTTDESPTPITLTGTYTCLPKVDTGGPVTLECAFGLKTGEGYYSLDMSSILTDNYPALYGNETITVEGVLVPKAMLSSDRWKTYDVIGVISVEKVIVQ